MSVFNSELNLKYIFDRDYKDLIYNEMGILTPKLFVYDDSNRVVGFTETCYLTEESFFKRFGEGEDAINRWARTTGITENTEENLYTWKNYFSKAFVMNSFLEPEYRGLGLGFSMYKTCAIEYGKEGVVIQSGANYNDQGINSCVKAQEREEYSLKYIPVVDPNGNETMMWTLDYTHLALDNV